VEYLCSHSQGAILPDIQPGRETVDIRIETITPQLAQAYLEKNKNREIKPGAVSKYARLMKDGSWTLNGEAIKFNGDGSLLDGQNRLLACIEAGVAFQSVVVRGLPTATQETMDQGVVRRAIDHVVLQGHENPYSLTRAAELIWRYRNGGLDSTATASIPETLQMIREEPSLRSSVEFAHTVKTNKYFPRFYIAALHFVFSEKAGTDAANTFFQRFADGVGLEKTDPIWHLRERTLVERANTKKALRQKELFAITIIAFNAWRRGTPMKLLKWATRGKTAQSFPQVL
jgi:hypothetical protein